MLIPTLFTIALASATFQPLHADRAHSFSFLRSDWNKFEENYHPNYVLDDDPTTAWVEGSEDDGVGVELAIETSVVSRVRTLRLGIKNGYQKSEKLLEANSAPSRVTITVHDDTGAEVAVKTVQLARTMGTQEIDIDMAGKGLSHVVLVIDAVHRGRVYRDTCISDIAISIDSDVPYNEKAELAKRDALLRWKANRVRAAAAYKADPKAWQWASTSMTAEETTLARSAPAYDKGALKPEFASVDALLASRGSLRDFGADGRAALQRLVEMRAMRAPAALPPDAQLRRFGVAEVHFPVPDGLWWLPPPLESLLKRADINLVEAPPPPAAPTSPVAPPAAPPPLKSPQAASSPAAPPTPAPAASTTTPGLAVPIEERRGFMGAYVEVGAAKTGDAIVQGQDILVRVVTDVVERVRTVRTEDWLLRYDDQGRLTVAAIAAHVAVTDGYMLEAPRPEDFVTTHQPGEQVRVIRFARNKAGRITAVEDIRGIVDPTYWEIHDDDDLSERFCVLKRRAS